MLSAILQDTTHFSQYSISVDHLAHASLRRKAEGQQRAGAQLIDESKCKCRATTRCTGSARRTLLAVGPSVGKLTQ